MSKKVVSKEVLVNRLMDEGLGGNGLYQYKKPILQAMVEWLNNNEKASDEKVLEKWVEIRGGKKTSTPKKTPTPTPKKAPPKKAPPKKETYKKSVTKAIAKWMDENRYYKQDEFFSKLEELQGKFLHLASPTEKYIHYRDMEIRALGTEEESGLGFKGYRDKIKEIKARHKSNFEKTKKAQADKAKADRAEMLKTLENPPIDDFGGLPSVAMAIPGGTPPSMPVDELAKVKKELKKTLKLLKECEDEGSKQKYQDKIQALKNDVKALKEKLNIEQRKLDKTLRLERPDWKDTAPRFSLMLRASEGLPDIKGLLSTGRNSAKHAEIKEAILKKIPQGRDEGYSDEGRIISYYLTLYKQRLKEFFTITTQGGRRKRVYVLQKELDAVYNRQRYLWNAEKRGDFVSKFYSSHNRDKFIVPFDEKARKEQAKAIESYKADNPDAEETKAGAEETKDEGVVGLGMSFNLVDDYNKLTPDGKKLYDVLRAL